jgi:ribonuclease R
MKKSAAKEAEGIVKRHPDGFGFFIPDNIDNPDVYIPRESMKGIMANDRVRVSVEPERGGDRFRGEILEVLKRAVNRVIGQYHESSPGRGIIFDKNTGWGEDLRVSVPPGIAIKRGELVVVQIEDYPGSIRGFSGRVLTVIGDAADPLNDSIRMLHTHNIPHVFSKETLKEAASLPLEVTEKDMAGRRDLRKIPIITIDGKTAKDFDDAIFTEKTARGFHLIVAIADVSHYVKEGSAIDKDAYERGTSTYFPNFVSPMLPEALSNELCSLKPKVPRLALVADMQFDFQGQLIESEFYEGVIQSQARVTYGEAQQVLEGNTPPEFKHVEANIKLSADFAKILMAKRFREGSLDLELPETEILVDDTGNAVDVLQSERLFAHRLIEEMMLMANVAVAKFFKEHDMPAIYRVHEEPRQEAMQNFSNFLKAFGFKEKLSGGHLQGKISKALDQFRDHPKSHILSMLALRSLMQAKYSPDNIGHFGLGFADYTHFTSPIRRYPDLIVHRLVKAKLYENKGYRMISEEDLATAGTMLSACEQRSVKAERQIKSIKKARLMQAHIGEEFDGLISSVTKFGLFVLLRQFDVDGLVRVEELGGDRYEFDEEKLCLVGRDHVFEIGDPLRIQVAKVDVEMGQIDFTLPPSVLNALPRRARTTASSHESKPRAEKSGGRSFSGGHKSKGKGKGKAKSGGGGGGKSRPRRPR